MNEDDSEITFPDDLKHLRIEGIAIIEVMRTAHYQGQHRLALESARKYARLVKRIAVNTEAEIESAIPCTCSRCGVALFSSDQWAPDGDGGNRCADGYGCCESLDGGNSDDDAL